MRIVVLVRSLLATLFVQLLFTALPAVADDKGDADEIAAIRALLATTQQGMRVGDIVLSPVGLYEISIQNGQSIYVSRDAKFLIPGDLYEARDNGLVNLGEERRNDIRRERIAALDESDMIVFEPKDGVRKATITVFTDIDCPYCRKLHAEIDALNAYGIAVRYLAFPRTGLNTEIHHRMVATWCAPDRKAMMTSAKRGGDIPAVDCANPVADQYQLGREVGVTGTPALVFDDGTIMPGYVEADTLANYLLGDATP
jgi:thiol:disulfide interchange protein DsbC